MLNFRPFLLFNNVSLSSIQQSLRGTIAPDGCLIYANMCENSSVCKRELLKEHFYPKIAFFEAASVRGNRSTPTILLIICNPGKTPIASRLRSTGTGLKSHRLNLPVEKIKLYIECPVFSSMFGFTCQCSLFHVDVHFFVFLILTIRLIWYRHSNFACAQ